MFRCQVFTFLPYPGSQFHADSSTTSTCIPIAVAPAKWKGVEARIAYYIITAGQQSWFERECYQELPRLLTLYTGLHDVSSHYTFCLGALTAQQLVFPELLWDMLGGRGSYSTVNSHSRTLQQLNHFSCRQSPEEGALCSSKWRLAEEGGEVNQPERGFSSYWHPLWHVNCSH